MDVRATAKYVHQSPRKVRLVTSAVNALSPAAATAQLQLMNKKAAKAVSDVIQSAVANATNNFKLQEDALWIRTLEVSEGPMLKRMSPRSRGRANTMLRRQAHIRVVITDDVKPVKASKQTDASVKKTAVRKAARNEKAPAVAVKAEKAETPQEVKE